MDGKSIFTLIREELDDDEQDELLDYISENNDEDLEALEPPVEMQESFPCTVFIRGLPQVEQSKYERLMKALNKYFDKAGPNKKYMPMDEKTGKTHGFLIATYEDSEAADTAVRQMDDVNLDKNHKMRVVKMDDFDGIVTRKEEFEHKTTLDTFSRTDFRTWLSDKKCREQLLLRYQNETEIYWHDTMAGGPILCYSGEDHKSQGKIWCDWKVQYSPQGSYVATFHKKGIILWAGPDFKEKVRFLHDNTKAIQFSPSEEYIMLWNGAPPPLRHDENVDNEAYAIFHVLTGQCVKKCRTPAFVPLEEDREANFPHFLWSADGKYYAECAESRIKVFETETFELIRDESGDPKTLPFKDLDTFQWSPKDNLLAVWTLEKDNNPARLVLVEIPSRVELVSRSRTQCQATMHWQAEGDYLCLLVNKLTKTKKILSTNLELFRIRDRGIPVDTVTITDTVRGFFWEARGNRFAVLTESEAGEKQCCKLLIYSLGKEKADEIVNFALPSNSFNSVIWAPDGQYFIVCSTGKMGGSGDLLFAGLTADNKLEILYKDEHYMLTSVQWDPTSRYVITAVTQEMESSGGGYKNSMEAGYTIRSFQGRILYRSQKEKLFMVAWRPHPPSLLSPEKQKEVRRNIKQYSKKYDAMDEAAKESARLAFKNDREKKTNTFLAVLSRLGEHKEEKEEDNGWQDARIAFQEDRGWQEDNQIIDEELDVTEELIPA